jgi:hypothetical protein
MIRKLIVLFLAANMAFMCLVGSASAAVIGTQQAISMDERQVLVSDIQSKLLREDVKKALTDLGVDPGDAADRVASLSNQELAQLDSQINVLPAGGGALAIIGAVFLVLLILELTGVVNVFSGV